MWRQKSSPIQLYKALGPGWRTAGPRDPSLKQSKRNWFFIGLLLGKYIPYIYMFIYNIIILYIYIYSYGCIFLGSILKLSKKWNGLVFREIVYVCLWYTLNSNHYLSWPSTSNEIKYPRCRCPTCPTTISVGIGKNLCKDFGWSDFGIIICTFMMLHPYIEKAYFSLTFLPLVSGSSMDQSPIEYVWWNDRKPTIVTHSSLPDACENDWWRCDDVHGGVVGFSPR